MTPGINKENRIDYLLSEMDSTIYAIESIVKFFIERDNHVR